MSMGRFVMTAKAEACRSTIQEALRGLAYKSLMQLAQINSSSHAMPMIFLAAKVKEISRSAASSSDLPNAAATDPAKDSVFSLVPNSGKV